MITMTAEDVINKARFFLNDDEDTAQVWEDLEMLDLVNISVSQVVHLRPDALYDDNGALITVTEASALGSNLSIDKKWLSCCALFTAWMALNKQSGQAFNADKVKSFSDQFATLIKV